MFREVELLAPKHETRSDQAGIQTRFAGSKALFFKTQLICLSEASDRVTPAGVPWATCEKSLLPACLEQPLGAVRGMMSPGVGTRCFSIAVSIGDLQ